MLLLLGLHVLAARGLLVANIELVHFPQYALLASVLYAGGLEPEAAWLLAAVAGSFDELYQHLVIYADRPDTYLDYNDMILNALGAAAGAFLFARARPRA